MPFHATGAGITRQTVPWIGKRAMLKSGQRMARNRCAPRPNQRPGAPSVITLTTLPQPGRPAAIVRRVRYSADFWLEPLANLQENGSLLPAITSEAILPPKLHPVNIPFLSSCFWRLGCGANIISLLTPHVQGGQTTFATPPKDGRGRGQFFARQACGPTAGDWSRERMSSGLSKWSWPGSRARKPPKCRDPAGSPTGC